MKLLFQILVIWFFLFLIFYLGGSFAAATFDITKWDSTGRALCGFFMICAFIFSGVVILSNNTLF